jgi:hypothetical protein
MNDAVRLRSRVLFGGAQYRLEVGAAISVGDLVTIKDLAEQLGEPPGKGSVNAELKVLEAVGLLERLPRVGSDRRVFLRAKPSPYWDTCRALIEDSLSAAASAETRQ